MSDYTVQTDDCSVRLLVQASNNDVDAFKRVLDLEPMPVDDFGVWYGCCKGSNRMVLEQRTPLMVAATYGSVEVIQLILSMPNIGINCVSEPDNSTAHRVASGGSVNVVDAVKILLAAGAAPNLVDANGHRPADVIVVPLRLSNTKIAIETLLRKSSNGSVCVTDHHHNLRVVTCSNYNSPPCIFIRIPIFQLQYLSILDKYLWLKFPGMTTSISSGTQVT